MMHAFSEETDDAARIAANVGAIRERISTALERSHRADAAVTLVAVTKTAAAASIHVLYELGLRHFGENRVEEARLKIPQFEGGYTWHMIGTLQRRKAREAVALFHRVDSVDRLSIAEALSQQCEATGRVMPVLLEVNVSGEATKHGFTVEETEWALDAVRSLAGLRVDGLMTMAPERERAEAVRPVFAALRELGARLGLRELSMGMSNDFEVAIEEGSTQVRIGRALFEGVQAAS